MNKQEYIAKYGEEAYVRRCEQNRHWAKQKYANALKYHERGFIDTKIKTSINSKLKFKSSMGDAGDFTFAQIMTINREHIEDLDKYILENLTKEAAEIDGEPRLVNEDFLYDCFVENCRYGLFYGNLQVIKYFVPLMCVKAHRDIKFTNKNIEMIKVFDEYRNTLDKKPINYSFKMHYIRPDQKYDLDKNIKCMLLYNLSADFMLNRRKYPTDKKLY